MIPPRWNNRGIALAELDRLSDIHVHFDAPITRDTNSSPDERNRMTTASSTHGEPINIGANHRSEEWYCHGLELLECGQYLRFTHLS